MNDDLTRLSGRLGYEWQDQSLLTRALTHRSKSSHNYERLEFLGDSVLGFVVTEWLFEQYPALSEGKLSRIRSRLVRRETLAKVARSLNLSDYLRLGEGELKSGGFNRDSILSDVVESLIGAIYLDAGVNRAREFIHQQFAEHFNALSDTASFKDPKSKLQEIMQKRGMNLPSYNIVATSGEQHQQEFTVQCDLADLSLTHTASAESRRAAEQIAAAALLQQLQET